MLLKVPYSVTSIVDGVAWLGGLVTAPATRAQTQASWQARCDDVHVWIFESPEQLPSI